MKKLLLTVTALTLALAAAAQTKTATVDDTQFSSPRIVPFAEASGLPAQWRRRGVASITASQTSLSNWAAGGEGQLALDAMLNYDADYARRRHMWQNRLELAYGLSNAASRGTRKTNDKIFLTSMYGYRLSQTWYASVLGVFSTQLAKGWNYSTSPRTYMSRFLAPGYLGVGAGFTWMPRTWFSAYLSPATWRGTFVLDDNLFLNTKGEAVYAPYGVAPGSHMRSEFGANARLEFDRDLPHGIHLYSRLDLFSDYLHKPLNVDVRWYVLATARINRWLSATASLNLLYDDDIRYLHSDGTVEGPKLQLKEILGLGFQTRF